METSQDEKSVSALQNAAARAASLVAKDWPDELVVLGEGCPAMPGEQGDDGVRALAAIDVLRHLVERYEEWERS